MKKYWKKSIVLAISIIALGFYLNYKSVLQPENLDQEEIKTKEKQKISSDLKIGDKLGEFIITNIVYCDGLNTNPICGIETKGNAQIEGSFFLSSYFGDYCFEVNTKNKINSKAITFPETEPGTDKQAFCFTNDPTKEVPEKYLPHEYELRSEPVLISISNFVFDWRPLGAPNVATFISIK